MKRYYVLWLFALCSCDAFSGPELTEPLSADSLLKHLNVLADDSMRGREAGTAYGLMAAEYVRGAFANYGLQSGVTSYFQTFTFEVDVIPVLAPGEAAAVAVPGSGWIGTNQAVAERLRRSASVFQEERTTQNVIGVLPGRGTLVDEWVIIGAHYDHIGFDQEDPDSIVIYNGADDNASGTAMMLEIARHLHHYFTAGVARALDRRSLMVVGFGAEEEGLLGSRHFIQNPTVDRSDITAMINLDMVGRLRSERLHVYGAYTSRLWDPLLDAKNEADLDLVLPTVVQSGSDHYPFYLWDIPVLAFYTGTHDQYHEPYDDVELINTTGMVTIGDLVVQVLLDLLVRDERPTWVD